LPERKIEDEIEPFEKSNSAGKKSSRHEKRRDGFQSPRERAGALDDLAGFENYFADYSLF
jgi:hypothetical protein